MNLPIYKMQQPLHIDTILLKYSGSLTPKNLQATKSKPILQIRIRMRPSVYNRLQL